MTFLLQALITFSHKKIPIKPFENSTYCKSFYCYNLDCIQLLNSNFKDIPLVCIFEKEEQEPASIILGVILESQDKLSEALTILFTMHDNFLKKGDVKNYVGLLVDASNSSFKDYQLDNADENRLKYFQAIYILNQSGLEDLKSRSVPSQQESDDPSRGSLLRSLKGVKKGGVDWETEKSINVKSKAHFQEKEHLEGKLRDSEKMVRSLK